jgi:nitroreductase
LLPLSPDELLSTTRAVRRRLDFDRPVPLALVKECLELALQAPSGSNAQGWHFVLVTDPAKRARIGELYRQQFAFYRSQPYSAHALAKKAEGSPEQKVMAQVVSSADYLAENLHRAPALLIPCIEGRIDGAPPPLLNVMGAGIYGSILPAVWSFMLAARARGLGTAWTTLHLLQEKAIAELLGIPYERVMQVALTPVAFTRGTDFKPAKRRSLDQILHVDAW